MTSSEPSAVLTIALLAAFADGAKDDQEHAAIRRAAEGFQLDAVDLAGLYQQVLTKKATLQTATAELVSPEAKDLAYELARCVCEASGPAVAEEQALLDELKATLYPHLVAGSTATELPAEAALPTAPLESILLKYAILASALELLPQKTGALAIIPVQMKLVYDVGQRHGVQLDRLALRDFAAALGVGAVAQVLEAGVRKLLSSLLGGEKVGDVTGGVAGTALTFATTYALGTVADRYYSSGRTLDLAMLKEEFTALVGKAKTMQAAYGGQITEKAQELAVKFKDMDITKILGGILPARSAN